MLVSIKILKKRILTENVAVLLLLLSIILLVGLFFFYTYINEEIGVLTGGIIVCIISMANAILLYLTLTSQNDGIANEKAARRQERFETTFFNLLEFHRKLVEEISIETYTLDENWNVSSKKLSSRNFFHFAISELRFITVALESNIEEKYDEEGKNKAIEAFEYKWSESGQSSIVISEKQREKIRLDKTLRIEFCNLLYSISKENREKYHSDKCIPYAIFREKWYDSFEHYIRNLYYILNFINEEQEENEEDKKKYIRFVHSQMSRAELNLIEIHAKVFPFFQKILNETHLMEIVTNK